MRQGAQGWCSGMTLGDGMGKEYFLCFSDAKTTTKWKKFGFPCGSAGKESDVGELGLIPGLGRSPGEGKRLPTPVF